MTTSTHSFTIDRLGVVAFVDVKGFNLSEYVLCVRWSRADWKAAAATCIWCLLDIRDEKNKSSKGE
jgi:hypothetical protein